MQYFIADLHFFHKMKIRPQFSSVEDMNKYLIKKWNSIVQPKDEVFILGDMFFRATTEDINATLQMLNGRKYLIVGNHDKYINHSQFDRSAFEWIRDYYKLKYNKRTLILCHYPLLEWENKRKGAIHLYGHVHNDNPQYYQMLLGNSINVGADVLDDFSPISIDEVISRVDNRETISKVSAKIELTVILEGRGIKTYSSQDNVYEAIEDVIRDLQVLWDYD